MAVQAFTRDLTEARVPVLAYVRAIAPSRRPGFATAATRTDVKPACIQYRIIPARGIPKAGQHVTRTDDVDGYERVFREHLDLPASRSVLKQPVAVAHTGRMCVKTDPANCHRNVIAAGSVHDADSGLSKIVLSTE